MLAQHSREHLARRTYVHCSEGSEAPRNRQDGAQGAQGQPHLHRERSPSERSVRMRHLSFLVCLMGMRMIKQDRAETTPGR